LDIAAGLGLQVSLQLLLLRFRVCSWFKVAGLAAAAAPAPLVWILQLVWGVAAAQLLLLRYGVGLAQ
jgi:hypothetical protein